MFYAPNIYEVWTQHYEISQTLKMQDEKYMWRNIIDQDPENLYVCSTLFNGVQATRSPFSVPVRYTHNLYSLGGWTCPAPLEQYLLNEYDLDQGLFDAFIDESKNVYFIETTEENRVERLLEYLRKEYNSLTNAELVNSFSGINIFRFYIDEDYIASKVEDDNNEEIIENVELLENEDGSYTVNGWCKIQETDPYKQSVWIELSNSDRNTVQTIKADKIVSPDLSNITGDLHDAATGINVWINADMFERGETEIRLVIKNEEKALKSLEPIGSVKIE